jgi:hypothetical protein
MTIAAASLTTNVRSAIDSTLGGNTLSASPAATALLLMFVTYNGPSVSHYVSTVTGWSLTWNVLKRASDPNGVVGIDVFYALTAGAPGSAPATITFSTTGSGFVVPYSLVQITGVVNAYSIQAIATGGTPMGGSTIGDYPALPGPVDTGTGLCVGCWGSYVTPTLTGWTTLAASGTADELRSSTRYRTTASWPSAAFTSTTVNDYYHTGVYFEVADLAPTPAAKPSMQTLGVGA